jgi:hypothetical protein
MAGPWDCTEEKLNFLVLTVAGTYSVRVMALSAAAVICLRDADSDDVLSKQIIEVNECPRDELACHSISFIF